MLFMQRLKAKGINFRKVSATELRVSFDEQTTEALFAEVLSILGFKDVAGEKIPAKFLRTSKYLTTQSLTPTTAKRQ